jgi:hypothetical protein
MELAAYDAGTSFGDTCVDGPLNLTPARAN